jgi:hypothetical protein
MHAHWLLQRLEQIGKTPTELARHMAVGLKRNFAKQRVYEIYTPNKHGKLRRIQQDEWAPLAAFLGWTVEELEAQARGFVIAARGTNVSMGGVATVTDRPTADGLKFRSVRGKRGDREGFMLYADEAAGDQPKAFYINVLDDKNEPVYRVRDTLVVDPNYEITIGEDCVFTTGAWPPNGGFCIIARLLRETPKTWLCKAIGDGETFELDRAEFPTVWAIIERRRPPV